MTYRELRQISDLRHEIERDMHKLEELRRKAVSSTSVLSDSRTSHAGVSDKVGNYAARIVDLEAETKRNLERLVKLETQITEFVNGIEDAHIRLLIKLHYIDGLPWYKVALQVGGGNTDQTVRQAVKRYLNK